MRKNKPEGLFPDLLDESGSLKSALLMNTEKWQILVGTPNIYFFGRGTDHGWT
jgi:hypothetical protein